MRKQILFVALSLILVLLLASLLWGETETSCPKSKMSPGVTADPHCAQAGQCQMSQNPSANESSPAGCQMMAGKQMNQSEGMMPMYCQMMGDGQMDSGDSMMPMCHQMMRQMRMDPKGSPEMRHRGHPVEKALHHLGGPEYFLDKAKKFDLSDDQIEQLKGLKNEQRKWNIQKKADIGVAQVELEELLDNKAVNFDKIKTKISQIADMEKELLLSHLSTIQKTHKVLTAEQMEKAESMKKKGTGRRSQGPRQVIKEVIIEEEKE